jgi:hypothetical protein
MAAVIAATGSWLYDGAIPTPVLIVRLDYDFWYSIGEADGDLADGDAPDLNPEGHLYYVRTTPGWSPSQAFWADSLGFKSLVDAAAAAQDKVPGPITWA